MSENRVLIIDDDPSAESELRSWLLQADLAVESVSDSLLAMEKLAREAYRAVVLDPMIRHRLNGYTVLSYIELEHPELLNRLFLLTGMSRQTIERTAPTLVSRLFRKPLDAPTLVAAILADSGPKQPAEINSSALLVEDDPATAAATTQILEEYGYLVVRVSNGGEALSALATADFGVIVLDLVMPGVDGFTVLDQLQSTRPHLLRRVIVSTGIPERYAEGLEQGGICGVIRKPINVSELLCILRRAASTLNAAEPPPGQAP